MSTESKNYHIFRIVLYIVLGVVVVFAVLPFLWMVLLSFETNNEIFTAPLELPKRISFENYRRAFQTLNFLQLYGNTFFIAFFSMIIELVITFLGSFVLARMLFTSRHIQSFLYGFLISGLTISPFILLFPVYRINALFHLREQLGLVLPYAASSISFNTLLFVGYLRNLPSEIDEAAVIDGCGLWNLILQITVPVAKPVIITVIIFNVLYIWNEFPFASIIIHNAKNYTLSLGASFFKGRYNIDYAGLIASSVIMIIPQLLFYGLFQKNIVEGMTAGAVKG